ncbi:MAG: helix-turn-helix transcriptional regulator [Clostridiales bacterium]|nr:helix-turn-helix transcriptional regulator [Clostridiales bacterium]
MILAEKIMDLRKMRGWSQEDLANELNVSRQSVSKWESGNSVPDIEKIIAISGLFGVSTDYLLKDNSFGDRQRQEGQTIERETDIYDRFVSIDEARRFIDDMMGAGKKIALGIFICILSPVTLIQLGGISETGDFITDNMAGAIGLIVLFGLVAIGVATLVTNGMKIRKYEDFEVDIIRMFPDAEKEIKRMKEMYEGEHGRKITVGVVMCIISVVPLLVAGAFDSSDLFLVTMVSFLLIVNAFAVYKLVRTCIIYGSFQKLLQEGDYTAEKKMANSNTKVFQKVYWSTVVAVYLLVSFTTNRWDMSWIIWPVAGVLFGGIYIVISTVANKR